MEQKSASEICAALAKPFAPEDLEWRLQVTIESKMRGIAVPYVTNRAIQSRLDEAVGPANWYNDYRPWHGAGKKDAQLCGISIYFEGRGFVTKWDGAEDSDIEPVKGGLSDSMKRAAVQWGVGRVLYNMSDPVWVNIEKKGKSLDICDSERPKLDKAYLSMLERLGLTAAPPCGTQCQLTPTASTVSEQEAQGSTGDMMPNGPSPKKVEDIPQQKEEQQTTQGTRQNVDANRKPAETHQKNDGKKQKMQEPDGKRMEFPRSQESEYEYIVESVRVQNGMTSKSTTVMLKDKDGNVTKAFARGVYENLVPGAKLKAVRLSLKKQNTVVFNYLESFEVATPAEKAA